MEDISLLGGGVFGDLDDIFGILYGDYTIWDDYLVFELIYFVFLLVHLVCWATYLIFGYTPVCILDAVFCFFDDFLVFWMVHFWGPTVRGPICLEPPAPQSLPPSQAPSPFPSRPLTDSCNAKNTGSGLQVIRNGILLFCKVAKDEKILHNLANSRLVIEAARPDLSQ